MLDTAHGHDPASGKNPAAIPVTLRTSILVISGGPNNHPPPPQSFIFYSGDLSNPCSLNQAHGMLSIMAVLYNSSQT